MAEQVNDRTQCPGCFDAYTASGSHVPRLLPCGHSLCEGCIDNLITIGRIRCPKDGKKFESTTGIRRFPQNESILGNLRKDSEARTGGTGQFQICRLHGREISLYCRELLCKKAICQLCMIQNHNGHNVVDIIQNQKDWIQENLQSLRNNLVASRNQLTAGKQEIDRKTTEMIQAVRVHYIDQKAKLQMNLYCRYQWLIYDFPKGTPNLRGGSNLLFENFFS